MSVMVDVETVAVFRTLPGFPALYEHNSSVRSDGFPLRRIHTQQASAVIAPVVTATVIYFCVPIKERKDLFAAKLE